MQAADLGLVLRFDSPQLGRMVAARTWTDIAADKPDATGYTGLAKAARKRGDHASALQLFAAGAEAFPQDPEMLNEAAWEMVTCPATLRQPDRAVALAREAVRLSGGTREHIVDTLAEALLVAGRFDEAQAENDRLLQLDPGSDGGTKRRARIAAERAKRP